jgi:hypothetical protein
MVQIHLTRDMKAEHELAMNQAMAEMQQQIAASSARVERRYEEMLVSELAKQKQEFEARALLSSHNAGSLVATHEHNVQEQYLTEIQQLNYQLTISERVHQANYSRELQEQKSRFDRLADVANQRYTELQISLQEAEDLARNRCNLESLVCDELDEKDKEYA